MCMCVYIYIYTHICTHILYTYIYIYIYVYIYILLMAGAEAHPRARRVRRREGSNRRDPCRRARNTYTLGIQMNVMDPAGGPPTRRCMCSSAHVWSHLTV